MHQTYGYKRFCSFPSIISGDSLLNLLKGSPEIPIPEDHQKKAENSAKSICWTFIELYNYGRWKIERLPTFSKTQDHQQFSIQSQAIQSFLPIAVGRRKNTQRKSMRVDARRNITNYLIHKQDF